MATTNAPSEIKMGYGGFCGVDWKTTSLVQQSQSTILSEQLSSAHRVFITGGNVSLQFNRPQ